MPNLDNHQSSQTTKAIVISPNGGGKTGALASLAKAGYNLRIFDLDNGLDVLANLLRSDSEALRRVSFQTITDPMKNVNGKLVPKATKAWLTVAAQLGHWKTESEDFGPLTSWTPNDVLVIDSLSMLATAAMNFVLSMNQRLGQKPHQSDWWEGQQLLEQLFQMLYDENVRCNVIVNAHIVYIGEEGGALHGYPATLGKALSPKIGSYFNSILGLRTVGFGAAAKRKLLTNSYAMVELKNSAPTAVQAEYPIETGLADYFKAVRGQGAQPQPQPSPSHKITDKSPSTRSEA